MFAAGQQLVIRDRPGARLARAAAAWEIGARGCSRGTRQSTTGRRGGGKAQSSVRSTYIRAAGLVLGTNALILVLGLLGLSHMDDGGRGGAAWQPRTSAVVAVVRTTRGPPTVCNESSVRGAELFCVDKDVKRPFFILVYRVPSIYADNSCDVLSYYSTSNTMHILSCAFRALSTTSTGRLRSQWPSM